MSDISLSGGGKIVSPNQMTCEAFIAFCDNMMLPAEEGIKSVAKLGAQYVAAGIKNYIENWILFIRSLLNGILAFKKVNVTRKAGALYAKLTRTCNSFDQHAQIIINSIQSPKTAEKSNLSYAINLLENKLSEVEDSKDFKDYISMPKNDMTASSGDIMPVEMKSAVKALNTMLTMLTTTKMMANSPKVTNDPVAKKSIRLVIRYYKLRCRLISKLTSFRNNVKSQKGKVVE